MNPFISKKLFNLLQSEKLSLETVLKVMSTIERNLSTQFSPSGKFLRHAQINSMKETVNAKDSVVWTSVLFPTEILHPFKLKPLTLEIFGAALSTVGWSSHFLNISDNLSVPPSMCSFHRLMYGFSFDKLLNRPQMVGATSLMCDGNLKSFTQTSKDQNVPLVFLDIPFEETKASVKYLKEQLIEITNGLIKTTGIKISEEAWKDQARLVNRHIKLKNRFITEFANKPVNLYRGFEIANSAFTFHYMLGSDPLEEILLKMCGDVESGTTPHKKYKTLQLLPSAKKLMWLHVVPQYPTPIWNLIDDGVRSKIVCDEYSSIVLEHYDENDLFASVAKRLINYPSNGKLENRVDHILKTARKFNVDGIVHYSSWGCHQAAGNVSLIEKALEAENFPVISLSGDATDPRNASTEQHRTRLEAFLEHL